MGKTFSNHINVFIREIFWLIFLWYSAFFYIFLAIRANTLSWIISFKGFTYWMRFGFMDCVFTKSTLPMIIFICGIRLGGNDGLASALNLFTFFDLWWNQNVSFGRTIVLWRPLTLHSSEVGLGSGAFDELFSYFLPTFVRRLFKSILSIRVFLELFLVLMGFLFTYFCVFLVLIWPARF